MIPTKLMTPHVPITVNETADQVLEAAGLGANMVHLHARDPETGDPTYRKEYYADIIQRVSAGIFHPDPEPLERTANHG